MIYLSNRCFAFYQSIGQSLCDLVTLDCFFYGVVLRSVSKTQHESWVREWLPCEGVAYLNTAAHARLPRVAAQAVEASLLAKQFPDRVDEGEFFEAPIALRRSIGQLIGASVDEVALTTGASSGLQTIAQHLRWRAGDEVITAKGEFPAQYATWKPMEDRVGLKLKLVTPRGQFIDQDDLIREINNRTRVVSVSHVRFDDGSLLQTSRLAAACRAQGVFLILDVSQSCGSLPIHVDELGADALVCAGYKWLLSPYGTGFFWIRKNLSDELSAGPFYWTGQDGDKLSDLDFDHPVASSRAKRWDDAETATAFNFNLVAMRASIDLILSFGPDLVQQHTCALIDRLFEALPKRCSAASPTPSNCRGAFGCFQARTPEATFQLFDHLRSAKVVVSIRQGNIRVSPHLFNTEADIDGLIDVVSRWAG